MSSAVPVAAGSDPPSQSSTSPSTSAEQHALPQVENEEREIEVVRAMQRTSHECWVCLTVVQLFRMNAATPILRLQMAITSRPSSEPHTCPRLTFLYRDTTSLASTLVRGHIENGRKSAFISPTADHI